MKQLCDACRRHRRLLLAAGYLAVLLCAVMYLRVTISVPPEGDDRLTLNKWLFDFERLPFWQYLAQDLGERLRYFTLQEVRFFPFHYPSAFSLLFFWQPDKLSAVHHRRDGGRRLPGQPRRRAVWRQRHAGAGRLCAGAGAGPHF